MPSIFPPESKININFYHYLNDGDEVKWYCEYYSILSNSWELTTKKRGEKLIATPFGPQYRRPKKLGWLMFFAKYLAVKSKLIG
jgi:hypothetical protein